MNNAPFEECNGCGCTDACWIEASHAVPDVVSDDRQRGLYGKYCVSRVDGKAKGPYFVLAYASDPHAAVALAAYADSCATEYPKLAADLCAAVVVTGAQENQK